MHKTFRKALTAVLALLFVSSAFLPFPTKIAQASTLSISPATGSYQLGETVELTVTVNTENKQINAIQTDLVFPPDKLEVITPTAGESVLGIYAIAPRFNNQNGTIQILGGIPKGLNTASGVVSKISFRVKGTGTAEIRFVGDTQVLLNDGMGTNDLRSTSGATMTLTAPEGQGPVVTSDTHPDPTKWYSGNTVSLKWDEGLAPATSYSYVFSTNEIESLDDIPEPEGNTFTYSNLAEGRHYFHIKALRDGQWSPTTRFDINSDQTAPSDFNINIAPSARTQSTRPLFEFSTVDDLSGIDRYELRLIPVSIEGRPQAMPEGDKFVSVMNPYVVSEELLYGTYQVVVRAYDKAGNVKETVKRLEITSSPFWFISRDGLALPMGQFSWQAVISILLFLILLLLLAAAVSRLWYKEHREALALNRLSTVAQQQLAELKRYRARYGKMMVLLLFLSVALSPTVGRALPKEDELVTSYSKLAMDDERFFISGRTSQPGQPVELIVSESKSGNSARLLAISDQRGDWLYRHNNMLPPGDYQMQVRELGADSSENIGGLEMQIKPSHIGMSGVSFSYIAVLGFVFMLMLALIAFLIGYIVVHTVLGRRHKKRVEAQMRHAEDAIKRGFIAVRKDIENELMAIGQAKQNGINTTTLEAKEKEILDDLKYIEQVVDAELEHIEDVLKEDK